MSIIRNIKKIVGIQKPFTYEPAECEYFIICEMQYGTQQCSLKRGDCIQCSRRNNYINGAVGTDLEQKRYELLTEEGRKGLWGM